MVAHHLFCTSELWFAHDRLLTKARLARWHLGDPYCNNCSQFEETTIHIFRDCPVAVQIWNHLLSSQERGRFYVVDFKDWVTLNMNNNFGCRHGSEWNVIWATTCYLLWQWRNKSTHDPEFVRPHRPWQVAVNLANAYLTSTMVDEQVMIGRAQQEVDISWAAPSPGWFLVNSDGAAKNGEGKAGCGGVLRNDNGIWMEGFAKNLGDTNAYMAELWGIYECLNLAQRRGVTRLELHTDSQAIAKTLEDRKNNGSIRGNALMRKIRALMEGPWDIKIIHVFREANRCADMLANMGSEGNSGIVFFENPPPRVRQIVDDDLRGVSFPRLISV